MNDKYQCLNIDEIFWKNRLFIDFSLNLILNINLQVESKFQNFHHPNCNHHQFIVEISIRVIANNFYSPAIIYESTHLKA